MKSKRLVRVIDPPPRELAMKRDLQVHLTRNTQICILICDDSSGLLSPNSFLEDAGQHQFADSIDF